MGNTVSGLFSPCDEGTYSLSFTCDSGDVCRTLDGYMGAVCTIDPVTEIYTCTNGVTCDNAKPGGTSFTYSTFLSNVVSESGLTYFDLCDGLSFTGGPNPNSVDVEIAPSLEGCVRPSSSVRSSSARSSAASSGRSSTVSFHIPSGSASLSHSPAHPSSHASHVPSASHGPSHPLSQGSHVPSASHGPSHVSSVPVSHAADPSHVSSAPVSHAADPSHISSAPALESHGPIVRSSSAHFASIGRFSNSSSIAHTMSHPDHESDPHPTSRGHNDDGPHPTSRGHNGDGAHPSSGPHHDDEPSGVASHGGHGGHGGHGPQPTHPGQDGYQAYPGASSANHGNSGPKPTRPASWDPKNPYEPFGALPPCPTPSFKHDPVTAWPDTTYMPLFGGKKTSLCKCATVSGAYGDCNSAAAAAPTAKPVYYWPDADGCPVKTYEPFASTNPAPVKTKESWSYGSPSAAAHPHAKPNYDSVWKGQDAAPGKDASPVADKPKDNAAPGYDAKPVAGSPSGAAAPTGAAGGYKGPYSNSATRSSSSVFWVLAIMFGLVLQSCSATSVNSGEVPAKRLVATTPWRQFALNTAAQVDAINTASGGDPAYGTEFLAFLDKALCQSLNDAHVPNHITLEQSRKFLEDCQQPIYNRNALVYDADSPGAGIEFAVTMMGSLVCNYVVKDALAPGDDAHPVKDIVCNAVQPCSQDLLSDANNCGACGTVCPSGKCVNGACTSTQETCQDSTCSDLEPSATCGSYVGEDCNCGSTSNGDGFCVPGNDLCLIAASCDNSNDCSGGQVCIDNGCCAHKVCMEANVCSSEIIIDIPIGKRSTGMSVARKQLAQIMGKL